MKTDYYGAEPDILGVVDLDWEEYMNYQYLPILIGTESHTPDNLRFAYPLIDWAEAEEARRGNDWKYVYVTAKRSFATPGNPLNRPGWHADGFGTPDINYVWTDKYPTEFAIGDFGTISDDHIKSVQDFEWIIRQSLLGLNEGTGGLYTTTYPDKSFMRLDDRVVHAAPEIPAPGGIRSFFKVSFSNEKYNLKGNAHNYGLDYNWEMHDREEVRNDPAKAGKDAA